MKEEILNLIDFLSKPLDEIFENNSVGNCGFYFGYDAVTFSNCYSGMITGIPPRRHKKYKKTDLYGQVQDLDSWNVVCISNITKENARVLEALCIKYFDEKCGLHRQGSIEIIKYKALNKRRERMWEELIPERIINGNNAISITGR